MSWENLISAFLGALLGAVASLLIAHLYYRRASADLEALERRLAGLVGDIESQNQALGTVVQTIHDASVHGTPWDPQWPYK